MKEKRNLFLVTALCGMTAITAGCSSNWVAGDPPQDFYIDDPVPVVEPVVTPVTPPVGEPVLKPVEAPVAKPVIPPNENIPTTPDISYTVQKGETLADISRVFGVPAKDIASRNGLAVSAKLSAGQTIFIPADKVALKDAKKVKDVKAVPAPKKPEPKKEVKKEEPKAPAKEAAKTDAPADKTVVHVVKKGDMLSKLAVQYKVSYFEIAKANNIKVDSVLQIGQKLVIPLDKAKKPGKTQPVKAPAKKEAAPAKKEAAPAKKEAAPAKKEEAPAKKEAAPAKKEEAPAENAGDVSDMFNTDFDDSDAEKPAEKPVAKPVAKPAPKKAAKAAVESWDIMVLKVGKSVTVEEFARINGRSTASVLALNPTLTAESVLAEGTEVKVFIDPERQQ